MWMLWNIGSSCEVHAEHEPKHRSFMDSSFEIFLSSEFLLLKDQDYIKMSFIPMGDNDFLSGWQMFSFPLKSYWTNVKYLL